MFLRNIASRFKLAAAATLFGAAAVTLTVGTAAAEDLPETIRIGAVASASGKSFATGLTGVAHVKQFIEAEFKDTPVKVEWVYFTGAGPAINEAFANKQIEFAQYGILPALLGHSRGLPTKAVLSYGGVTTFAVVGKDSPVTSVAELKGKRIGVQLATMMHWALLETLKQNGLTAEDVTLVNLKGVDLMPALVAGDVDAAFSASELLTLQEQGLAKIIFSSRNENPRTAGQGNYVASQEFIEKYPEATQRVVTGLLKAAHWLAQPENLNEDYDIWAKSGVSTSILKGELDGVDLKTLINPRLDDFYLAHVKSGIEFAKANQLIRGDVDPAGYVDTRFYEKAVNDLGYDDFWPKRNADGTTR